MKCSGGEAKILLVPGFMARTTELSESPNGGLVKAIKFTPNQILSLRIQPLG
jgi:hypothetical protein